MKWKSKSKTSLPNWNVAAELSALWESVFWTLLGVYVLLALVNYWLLLVAMTALIGATIMSVIRQICLAMWAESSSDE